MRFVVFIQTSFHLVSCFEIWFIHSEKNKKKLFHTAMATSLYDEDFLIASLGEQKLPAPIISIYFPSLQSVVLSMLPKIEEDKQGGIKLTGANLYAFYENKWTPASSEFSQVFNATIIPGPNNKYLLKIRPLKDQDKLMITLDNNHKTVIYFMNSTKQWIPIKHAVGNSQTSLSGLESFELDLIPKQANQAVKHVSASADFLDSFNTRIFQVLNKNG